jgi:hypothetical protein
VQQIEVPPDGTRVVSPGKLSKLARQGMLTRAWHAVCLRLQSQRRPPKNKASGRYKLKGNRDFKCDDNGKELARPRR